MVEAAAIKSMGAATSAIATMQEASVLALDTAQAIALSALAPDPRRRVSPIIAAASGTIPDLAPTLRRMVSIGGEGDNGAAAPPAVPSAKCAECDGAFGATRYRYHCGYCSGSFCREHLPEKHTLHTFGGTQPVRLCAKCAADLAARLQAQGRAWRVARVQDFLADQLRLYEVDTTDTTLAKAGRMVTGTVAVAKVVPLALVASSGVATATRALVGAEVVGKVASLGHLGFVLRHEFAQTYETLRAVLGGTDTISVRDAAGGLYYMMAANRGRRGRQPLQEQVDHAECAAVPDALLVELLQMAPLALQAIYERDVLALQRFVKLQGYALVVASVASSSVHQPGFALVASTTERTAVLVIRGSQSVHDLLTDLQITSGSANDYADVAHHGMATAAAWIYEATLDALREFDAAGFRVVLAGHSLGGGVAALLATKLQPSFPTLQCYGFAVPACMTAMLADECTAYVHSVVLRDDLIPRAKPESFRELISAIKAEPWKTVAEEDFNAVKARVKSVWAPRTRNGAVPPTASASLHDIVVCTAPQTSEVPSASELFVPGE
ncbi:hypothetical protein ACHHYP_06462, partial [Achlya hypogyna]